MSDKKKEKVVPGPHNVKVDDGVCVFCRVATDGPTVTTKYGDVCKACYVEMRSL